ncbi:hypothetical protein OSL47_25745, partial [Escherichia coli]|nr:hypothetical protein [Escherichia coli]
SSSSSSSSSSSKGNRKITGMKRQGPTS